MTVSFGLTVEYVIPFMVVVMLIGSDGTCVSRMMCGSALPNIFSEVVPEGMKNTIARIIMLTIMIIRIGFLFVKDSPATVN